MHLLLALITALTLTPDQSVNFERCGWALVGFRVGHQFLLVGPFQGWRLSAE